MTSPGHRPHVLFVDDDSYLLSSFVRALRHHYAVVTAVGGAVGLDALEHRGPFAALVCDLRMPDLDGVAVLQRAREIAPYTTRVLLTGQANVHAAIEAVNEGHIFRFIAKPCSTESLVKSIDAAVEQYRLVTAERVLLERTLHGAIKTLTDILALAQPAAFGRAVRVKEYVADLLDGLGLQDRWYIEVATMVSQIACVTLPEQTAERLYQGGPLTEEERAMVNHLPAVTAELLLNIPRLEEVREIVIYQDKQFDGGGTPPDDVRGKDIPLGARILKVVLDFDRLQTQGYSATEAFDAMARRHGWYDASILGRFARAYASKNQASGICELPLRAVQPGMVFAEDVRTRSGILVIARGQEVTPSLAERLKNLDSVLRLNRPVKVVSRPALNRAEALARSA